MQWSVAAIYQSVRQREISEEEASILASFVDFDDDNAT
jgi:hypothetical protein